MQTLSLHSDSAQTSEHLVFLHANGFPPGTYASLLNELVPLGRISTLEHRPLWQAKAPKFLDWEVYAEDAIATLRKQADRPVWLVGHSMGGAISLLIAHKAPELVKGIVALDPVTINSPFLAWSRLAFRLWPNKPRMIQGALGRPHHFESHQTAFEFYRGKRAFAGIADKELMDYVTAAHASSDQGVTLRFSGEWEACVYRSPPSLWSKLRKLTVPVHILGGKSSYVITPAVAERLRGYSNLQIEMMDAGHLLPMEKPLETAAFVTRVIGMSSCTDQAS